MQLIRSFREQYASFGIWVMTAYSYFILVGGIWLWESKSWVAAIFTLLIGAMFYFKNKLANLISGVLFLFLSIGVFLEAASLYVKPGTDARLMLGFGAFSILFSGILIFSFPKAVVKE